MVMEEVSGVCVSGDGGVSVVRCVSGDGGVLVVMEVCQR